VSQFAMLRLLRIWLSAVRFRLCDVKQVDTSVPRADSEYANFACLQELECGLCPSHLAEVLQMSKQGSVSTRRDPHKSLKTVNSFDAFGDESLLEEQFNQMLFCFVTDAPLCGLRFFLVHLCGYFFSA